MGVHGRAGIYLFVSTGTYCKNYTCFSQRVKVSDGLILVIHMHVCVYCVYCVYSVYSVLIITGL